MTKFWRYLRIVFSAFCGLACVLLIVLWVRSYDRADVLMGGLPGGYYLDAASGKGRILIVAYPTEGKTFDKSWKLTSQPASALPNFSTAETLFHFKVMNNPPTLSMPHWPIVVLAGALGIMPWLFSRFSLRTLLLAITLVAVVLGLIVFFSS